MNRGGISQFVDDVQLDYLGFRTKFRLLCESVVKSIVNEGKWFSFCTKINKEQVDVIAYKNDKGVKVGDFIKDIYSESSYKTAIYKYLLTEFLCYCEVPNVVKTYDTSWYKSSYNKFLVTSNLGVVAAWMGISLEEAEATYGDRLYAVHEDDGEDLFQYLKLYETKEGVRKITKPRKPLDLGVQGTRIIPVFALKVGVDLLYEKLLSDTYDVTFCKDSGQVRTLNTTFNVDKIRSIYNDTFTTKGTSNWYEGDFISNPNMERGYIRVFELGSSIYDNPLRSINYARIISFEKAEPDLTYINIDLSTVLDMFKDSIYDSKYLNIKEFVEALDVFDVGTSRSINGVKLLSVNDIENWADSQLVLLSTVFLRQLALFMLGNPQWFNGYTGEPVKKMDTTIETLNDTEFELDLG